MRDYSQRSLPVLDPFPITAPVESVITKASWNYPKSRKPQASHVNQCFMQHGLRIVNLEEFTCHLTENINNSPGQGLVSRCVSYSLSICMQFNIVLLTHQNSCFLGEQVVTGRLYVDQKVKSNRQQSQNNTTIHLIQD